MLILTETHTMEGEDIQMVDIRPIHISFTAQNMLKLGNAPGDISCNS